MAHASEFGNSATAAEELASCWALEGDTQAGARSVSSPGSWFCQARSSLGVPLRTELGLRTESFMGIGDR